MKNTHTREFTSEPGGSIGECLAKTKAKADEAENILKASK